MKVRPGAAQQTQTVWLIDGKNPGANHFVGAEEINVLGHHTKRPDVVLYVNGLALATLELKRSKVAVSEGIRQTIGNPESLVHPTLLLDRAARACGRRRRRSSPQRHRRLQR